MTFKQKANFQRHVQKIHKNKKAVIRCPFCKLTYKNVHTHVTSCKNRLKKADSEQMVLNFNIISNVGQNSDKKL